MTASTCSPCAIVLIREKRRIGSRWLIEPSDYYEFQALLWVVTRCHTQRVGGSCANAARRPSGISVLPHECRRKIRKPLADWIYLTGDPATQTASKGPNTLARRAYVTP